MKICGRCRQVKLFSEFNKDKYSKSGYRSQCKECMKKERADNKEYYKAYREEPERKAWYAEYRRSRYAANKKKRTARNATRKLDKEPCVVCGSVINIHAHHDDYDKPLDVRWLCAAHHKQWHVEHGEAKNP